MTSLVRRLEGGLGAAYWRLLAASVISNLGDGVFWVALPLLAVSVTDSPALIAGVTAVNRLPWLLFALFAGALVDRVDRRRAMVVVDVVRVVVVAALAIAVIADLVTIWVVYAVALVLGTLETIFDTAAQTVVPALVADRSRLSLANGRLFGAEQIANFFLGAPIGGLLVAATTAVAFGVTAAGFLGAALLLLTLPGTFRVARVGPRTSVLHEIGEGIRYLARDRVLRLVAFVVAVVNFASGAQQGVLVLYAVAPGPLGLDPVGYGMLFTVLAAGVIAGTLLAPRIERRLGKANILAGVIIGMAAQQLAMAVSSNVLVVGVALFAGWFMQGAFYPVFVSLRQRIVPDRLLGRVVATFRVLAIGTLPAGAIVGGAIAEGFGIQVTFWFAFLVTIAVLPIRLIVTDRVLDDAEAAAEAREQAAA